MPDLGYAVESSRLATRGRTLILGVVLFLASELMFFAAWFAAYFDLRGSTAVWPPAGVHLDPTESSIGTVILGVSSVLVILALRVMRANRTGAARALLASAALCGIIFLALTIHEWKTNSFTFASSAYASLHYGITGFHAAHVTAGIVLLVFLAAACSRPAFRAQNFAGAEAISYYWHFVFVIWLVIWSMIWFLR